jgi:hypothetical protein
MSGKTSKAERKENEAAKQDYLLRKEAMFREIRDLSQKYRIDLVPVINTTEQGIVPMIAFVDVKKEYEHMTAEAKEAEKKQTNGITMPNGVVKSRTRLET